MSHSLTMNDMNSTPEYHTTNAFQVGTSATTTNELQQHAPEWIELLPAGKFVGRDGRGPFQVSNAEAVIAATDALRMEAGLPIDYDHATDFAAPSGRRAPAAGWIRAIEVRERALWGKVEWTTHGSAAVATHEYRYISPVFEYSQNGEVQRILRAALTNNPNLYLTAISARESSDKLTTRVPMKTSAARFSEEQRGNMVETIEAQLCEMLGLKKGSTPEMIIGEVQKALGTNTQRSAATEISEEAGGLHATAQSIVVDPARYVPIEQFETALTELNQLRVATARERAAFRVDAAMKAGKIVPSQREWAIAYCQANTNGFKSFIARQPALITGVTEGFEGAPSGVRNGENTRDNEGMESRRAGASLTRTELAVCAKLGLRPHEYIRRRGLHDELTTLP